MAVKIRLRRTGSKNSACFRVVVADSRSPRDGRFIETLGWYDPKQAGVNFKLKLDRVEFWRSQGAELSETVTSLLKRSRAAGMTAESAEPVAAPVVDATEETEPVAAAE